MFSVVHVLGCSVFFLERNNILNMVERLLWHSVGFREYLSVDREILPRQKQDNIQETDIETFECTLREFKTRGLSCTRDTCWSSQLLQVLARSSMLLLLTVLWNNAIMHQSSYHIWSEIQPVKWVEQRMHQLGEDKVFPVLHCTICNMFVK